MIQHPQIVAVFLDFALDLVEQIAQLHDDDEASHREKDVAPQQHMQMVQQVDGESGHIETKFKVVGERATLVPRDNWNG